MSNKKADELIRKLRSCDAQIIFPRGPNVFSESADLIDRLVCALKDCYAKREALAKQRDEARDVAWELWENWIDEYVKDGEGGTLLVTYPWLEDKH